MKPIDFNFNRYFKTNPDNLIAVLYDSYILDEPFLYFLN